MQYHHIFFHSLVVEPEKAFNLQTSAKGDFESWMITVREYKAILESLYKRNYVLVKMSDLLQNRVRLPEGKIPLVISFDDVNYYEYMKDCGFADKMVLDEYENIANEYIREDGSVFVTTEADGPAILEEYIKEHPDFSYENARGILAVTGYEGVLGYREAELGKEPFQRLVRVLKQKGWEFACHSFSHKAKIFKSIPVNLLQCVEDTKQWLEKVEPYIGETNIYISPFGMHIQEYPEFASALKEMGFCYFCDVNNTRQYEVIDGCYYFPRINIDGFLFQYRNYEFEVYYGELKQVLDSRRTREYPRYGKNAEALAMHARVCSKMPTVYMWGGMGEFITKQSIEEKKKEYPAKYTEDYCRHLEEFIGKNVRGFDCSGLIKNYMMGGLINYKYDASLDYYSGRLLEAAEKSGTMDSFPDQRGLCLYMPGHVGIYMGRQIVIEATNNVKFGDGVVWTHLKDREWTHWFQCPTIFYETGEME